LFRDVLGGKRCGGQRGKERSAAAEWHGVLCHITEP
jgi:hypothetical protein